MKLNLSNENGISILTGTGDITSHDVLVLRAGLTKLFKSGKNRIILDLPEASKVPSELLREISELDALARELSGRIVVAGATQTFKEQIARFAKPPVIICFDSKKAAIEHFTSPPPSQPTTQAQFQAPTTTATSADELLKQKGAIRQAELKELTGVRTALAALENENQLLRTQLLAMMTKRKTPPTEEAYQSRIQSLEEEVRLLYAQVENKISSKGQAGKS